MNDDDLDLRIYARRGGGPRMLIRRPRNVPEASVAAASSVSASSASRRLPLLVLADPVPAVPAVRRGEEEILQILRAPPEWGEPVQGAFSRKERELAAVFEALAPAAARELYRRLSSPRAEDAVAASFARLIPERRGRLLAVLVSAHRRAARAPARRPSPQPWRKHE
jgi:hypothetical protein